MDESNLGLTYTAYCDRLNEGYASRFDTSKQELGLGGKGIHRKENADERGVKRFLNLGGSYLPTI